MSGNRFEVFKGFLHAIYRFEVTWHTFGTGFWVLKGFCMQYINYKLWELCPVMYLEFSKGFYLQYIGYKLQDVNPEMYSFCYAFGVFKEFIDAIY